MIEQNDRQENEGLIVEAVDVAGIDVLEEDIAALSSASGSCCGCGECFGCCPRGGFARGEVADRRDVL